MAEGRTRRGFFISLEGGDGGGKSTQIGRLGAHLRKSGRDVVETREPGGSPGAEAIRLMLVEGAPDRWSPLAEALMMYAARAEHLDQLIRPALKRSAIVITDRFADSTMAYQGIAGALGAMAVATLRDLVVGADEPDLTLIFDLPVATGLARAGKRPVAETRFEGKGEEYQEAVRQAFLDIARANPQRCVIVDATASEDSIFQFILGIVTARLAGRDQ